MGDMKVGFAVGICVVDNLEDRAKCQGELVNCR